MGMVGRLLSGKCLHLGIDFAPQKADAALRRAAKHRDAVACDPVVDCAGRYLAKFSKFPAGDKRLGFINFFGVVHGVVWVGN